MFLLKKNRKLKIKDVSTLEKDKNLISDFGNFIDKNGNFLTKKMLLIKEIKLQDDVMIGNNRPFFSDGWWWYPWMFQNIYTEQLKIE